MNEIEAKPQHDHGRAGAEVNLLSPLSLRGVTLRNRIAMSPMCQYSSDEGMANDWHLVHLGSRAAGGVALIMVEATAVTRDGRITPGDMGIWSDAHIAPLARIASFVESQGKVPGIQLAHAGRKASCDLPWRGGARLKTGAEGGWQVVAPSELPFNAGDPPSLPLDESGIDAIVAAFEAATRRALQAGFKVIEIHDAHGYLLHEFLSPLANFREDAYGGSLDNRMRLSLRVASAVRAACRTSSRCSCACRRPIGSMAAGTSRNPSSSRRRVKAIGIDLIDASSGGTCPTRKSPWGPASKFRSRRPFAKRPGSRPAPSA